MKQSEYHRKVNEIASFMHAYYDAAMKSGAIAKDNDESVMTILLAAMYDAYANTHACPRIVEEAQKLTTSMPSVSAEMPKLAALVFGGSLQAVISNTPEFFDGVGLSIIDYDACDLTPEHWKKVTVRRLIDDTESYAIGYEDLVSRSPIDLNKIFVQLKEDVE